MAGDPGEVPRRFAGDLVELRQRVARRFAEDLVELRQRAGRPSYSTLERLSGHNLRRATISDVLNGNRVKPPDWRFVATFVEACHRAALESGLDVQELGSLADWKRHWDAAANGVIDARFPGGTHQFSTRHDRPETSDEQVAPPPDEQGSVRLGEQGSVRLGEQGSVRLGEQSSVRLGEQSSVRLGEQSSVRLGEQSSTAPGADTEAMPSVWGQVPPRLTDFVGRETWLTRLHGALASQDRASAVAVQGLCGIGKTQLVVEYVHRYAGEYDLVWWIPCDVPESVGSAMADLRSRLGLPGDVRKGTGEEDDKPDAELFDTLRQWGQHARWLLVFDGADEPDEIRHLLPPMGGHVLVTSRNSRWEASGNMLELDVFSREESIEFLRARMPRYNPAQAHQIAEAVGDLPLILEHAVESRAAIDEYMALLHSDPLRLLEDQPSDYPAMVAAQWRDGLARIRESAPESLAMLSCLCFFGRAPVPREALERGSYLQDAWIHEVLGDPIQRNRAIMMLRRAGLLRVDVDARTLTVHQVTRCIVRDMVTRGGPDHAERTRHDVHLLLAAADPLNPDDPANWRSYEQLLEHVADPDADVEGCQDAGVRRLVVNLTRFLHASGDPRAALNMANRVLTRWDNGGGAVDPSGHLAMLQAKATALFACGRHAEAFQLQQDALTAMRATPAGGGMEMILLNRLAGARWRILGNFREALNADKASEGAHKQRFGDEHPHTFLSVNDVIDDLALNGQHADALSRARQLYRDCLAFHNDAGHPAVLFQRNSLGRCLWLSGQYGEAMMEFAEVNARYEEIGRRGILDQNHPWRLVHEVDYAVARRDSGSAAEDLEDLASHMHEIRRRCWRAQGADHPQTLAATVLLGSILRRIPGRGSEAARVIVEAERRYRATLPGHPYSLACRASLAAMRGSTNSAGRSVGELTDGATRLASDVGGRHPLTLTAVAALVNVLADSGQLQAALERGREALAASQATYGSGHPHALACEANLATIRARLGQDPEFGEIRARYAAVVGTEHPGQLLFGEGKLIYIDFTPLPLLDRILGC